MIVWILNSNSGTKLLYKSFLKTDTDEDIVSGFLTAFHQFTAVEFHQSLDSIEMGGLRWIYILEPEYNLLFVAADTKHVKTEMLFGRLHVLKNAFIDKFKSIWNKKGRSWDGNINIYLPFIKTIEDYYKQWEEVEILTDVADFFDILRVFQQILIMLRNVIENKMYSKSRDIILNRLEKTYKTFKNQKKFKNQPELKNISFSTESWFNIVDMDLIKCDKKLVVDYLSSIITQIVSILKEVKGHDLCFKYFYEERIFAYIMNSIKLLKDVNLDKFLLELFLLL
jgi:hypothetical protein